MADENDKPKKSGQAATPAILALSTILTAAPTLGLEQAIAEHGQDLTETERAVLSSLSPSEVGALAQIDAQLDVKVALADNNNNNNYKIS